MPKLASVNPIKYRETVEAMQLAKHNRDAICAWLNDGVSGDMNAEGPQPKNAWYYDSNGEAELYLKTSAQFGYVAVDGDWIVRYSDGVIYVFTTEEFLKRFIESELAWLQNVEDLAKAIANDRTVRRGGIASENVLSCLPAISRNDVIADAKAAIAALESQS